MLEFAQLEKRFCYMLDRPPKGVCLTVTANQQNKLNCSKPHQPGCSGYIESIPDQLDPDITVFLIHDMMAMIQMYHMPTVVNNSSEIIIRLKSFLFF